MPHANQVDLLPNQGWDERILVCRNGRLVQTFIVVTARYVVLVDTLINAATARQMVAFAEPFLAGRTLLVVNTHADYDHAWGNQLFVGPDAPFPAPVIASLRCAAAFAQPDAAKTLRTMQADEPAIFGDVRLTPPTLLFDEQLTIDGGDLTLQLFATPGHTPDHISLYIPEIETLLAGDAAELPYPAARTVDGLPLMRASLDALTAFDARTVLYCHAPVAAGPQLLHDNIAYFDGLERACRAARARGLPDPLPAGAALIDRVGCRYADVTPQTDLWRDVNPYYHADGHAEQLHMMLAWLGAGQP